MAICLTAMEVNINQYQLKLNEEKKAMYQQEQNPNGDQAAMSDVSIRIINQRSKILTEKMKIRSHFHVTYHFRSPYGRLEERHTGAVNKIQHRLGFVSNLIVDPRITHDLSRTQLQLLNRGPTYVPPCQLQVASAFQSMDTIVSNQYAPLQEQLALLFNKYSSTLPRSFQIQKENKEAFRTLFSTLIPSTIRQRAFYEQKIIQSMQPSFKKNNLLLRRTADQNNTFYLGDKHRFEEMCDDYMKQTEDRYKLLFTVTEHNEQEIRHELDKEIYTMNTELESLSKQKKIPEQIAKKLRIKMDDTKLSYLYFLPELATMEKGYISVKPMLSTYHSVTWKLANYLHRLVRPVLTPIMKRTTLTSESDFIEKLHQYCNTEHHLHVGTVFATIKITNFYDLFTHQYIIDALGAVLSDNRSIHQIPHVSIMTIEKLTEFVLDHQLFYYQGKIYRLIKGLPNSMLFSDTLLNVCLHEWQKKVLDDSRLKTELVMRYKDQIFFTWNHSQDDLHSFLTKIMDDHRQIKMNISIGRSAHYLNVYMENLSGQLYTCVDHPTNISQLRLPYVVGHTQQNHRHWFRSSLVRAVQLCCQYQDFVRKRIYMEMSCLVNGYSIDFIETELNNFYVYFEIQTYRFSMNETIYLQLRRRLLNFNDTQRQQFEKELDLEDNDRVIRLHYLYDYGPYQLFKEKFGQIWSTYIKNHPELSYNKTKILLTAKHLFSLNTLLTEQKPICSLLQ